MTVVSRISLQSAADQIRDETQTAANTAARVGGLLRNMADSLALLTDVGVSITAGNGLTGTDVFSVLADGGTLTVSASGVKVSAGGISGTELADSSVDLASAKVTGLLPYANMASLAGLSVLGRSAAGAGVMAAITGSDGQALRVTGGALGFGTLPIGAFADGVLTLAKLDNGAACSLAGRAANSSGVRADISVGTNDHVVMRTSNVVTSGFVANANVDAAAAIAGTKISPNFGSQTITSTGPLVQAATPAATGSIRWGSDANYSITGRTTGGTDRLVVQYDPTTPRITLGANGADIPGHIYLTSAGIQFRHGTDYSFQLLSSSIQLNSGVALTMLAGSNLNISVLDSNGAGATGGAINEHAGDATSGAGGGTGGDWNRRAGDATGASGTRNGGNIYDRPGTGGTTGGNWGWFVQSSDAVNFQSMQGGAYIKNAGAAPTGNPSGGGFVYETAGAFTHRGSGGTTTTMGPA